MVDPVDDAEAIFSRLEAEEWETYVDGLKVTAAKTAEVASMAYRQMVWAGLPKTASALLTVLYMSKVIR